MREERNPLVRLAALIAQAVVLAVLIPAPAAAQAVNTYVNNTSGNFSNSNHCVARTFSVGTNYLLANVEIGVFATHSRRGDLRMTLQSPAGTLVQIVDGDPGGTLIPGDNFNVHLSDSGTQVVNTDDPDGNHSAASPPPFQHTFIPNSALSAFAGESSIGTWQLEMCDVVRGPDNGQFLYGALFLTSLPANYADLSLTKAVSNASPASGASISYTVTVTNASSSPSNATGVTVTDVLPAGVSHTGHSGFGTYDPGTGLWTVGTLTPGQSRTLTINATVTATAGATIVNEAEVTTSSVADPDSTPGNGNTSEDDYDSVSFTVSGPRTAGTPPELICPAGGVLFDWDTRAWTAGATNASYAVVGLGTVTFSITNQGAWLNLLGGPNPVRTNELTGGITPVEYSLAETVNFANRTQVATTTIALPMAVNGLQLRLFDVDYGANQFADRVKVTGTLNGAPATPVLTNGVANYVIGNEAFGDAASNSDSANGTVTVTFQSAVDTVIIEYGNHSLAPNDPGQQAISIHDIIMCQPHATVTVTKTSSLLSDPVNGTTDPMAIPGAQITYCLLVANSGPAEATAITATDVLPPDLTYVAGSMRSGPTCATATTVEDDDAAGPDESDPIGASFAGGQFTITTASLAPSESIVLTFSATIN